MDNKPDLLVGLDGGGTSSRAALVFLSDGRRIEMRGGPANVSDFDGAILRIRDLLQRLAAEAELAPDRFLGAAAHLGLAGVMDRAIADKVAAEFGFAQVAVSDDQPTTIAGALGRADGAVAAIGTGSFVGRQAGGMIASRGGWGFVLGDQASGAWLGRQVLCQTLLAHDRMRDTTALAADMLARFGGAAGVTAFAISAAPADFAALAPDIVAAARRGDDLAVRAMQDGAGYISSALKSLGCRQGEPICLTGGLGPEYRDWLGEELANACVPPKGSALDGALVLARKRVDATT